MYHIIIVKLLRLFNNKLNTISCIYIMVLLQSKACSMYYIFYDICKKYASSIKVDWKKELDLNNWHHIRTFGCHYCIIHSDRMQIILKSHFGVYITMSIKSKIICIPRQVENGWRASYIIAWRVYLWSILHNRISGKDLFQKHLITRQCNGICFTC